MSPDDPDCYFDRPGMFTPDYDEVHISCVFTWDKQKAEELAFQWAGKAKVVRVGGSAYDASGGAFTPGLYLKHGVTITSRGCNNNCSFCLVPKREGKLRELEIKPGNVIQDNNLLACSDSHLGEVFSMLKTQSAIELKGGLEAARITPEIADRIGSLYRVTKTGKKLWRVKSVWLACDHPGAYKPLQKAVDLLYRVGLNRDKIYCYVLIGDNMKENEERLRRVWEIGAMPFAQLYQPVEGREYPDEWKQFARIWSRPAATKGYMKNVS